MADEIFENILSHFQIANRYQDKAQCRCPAHDDKQASLTITRGRKCVLFKCHAGCDTADVLRAAGIDLKDTFFDNSDSAKWKAYVEGREQKKIEAIYNYVSCDNGSYCFSKLRLEDKRILYGKLSNDRFTYGLGRDTPRKSYKAIYGSVKALKKAISEDRTIFIPEGEKDVDSLTKRGYTAFTYGGVNDWQSVFANVVRGANVVILADNDKPGLTVANNIMNDIKSVAKSARIIVPTPDIPHGDISDYFESRSKEDFERLISKKTDVKAKNPAVREESVYERLVRLKATEYERNDKGFSKLFSDVFADTHRYNSTRRDWMYYNGKVWINDSEGMKVRQSAKRLTDELIKYAVEHGDDKQEFLKSVMRLSGARARENVIKDSRDNYFFVNEELDQEDYILNCENGTLDLSGDEPKFLEHSSSMLLSKIAHVEYNPAADCPLWTKFLNDVMVSDNSKIEYLQKIAGLSLTGDTSQETMYILYGSTTRNGKSSYIETLLHLLGDYATTMQPQSLAQKQNTDSRQASGDIARLNGCRLVNASESPKKMLFDTSLLKSLLGRDSITARHIHEREFTFTPKFKLFMNTNYLPQIADDTVFSSGRINVISFDRHFEPHEQDKTLKNRLQKKDELSGILNWCIEGLRLYRQEGLEPPSAVKTATEQYRSDSDKTGSFISECLQKSDRNSKAKDIYDCYALWCESNGYGTENKANFFSELKNKNIFGLSGTVNGKTERNIVKGYVIRADFEPVDDMMADLPFK